MKKYIIAFSLLVAATTAPSTNFVDQANTLISNQKQLTFVGSRSGEGYFSADGKKMIYQSEREEGNPFYQMFVLDLESGKSSRVSTGVGMTTCGWIHPNLKKAMWSSTHLDKKFKEKVKAEYDERAKPVKKRYSWSYDDQYDIFESDLNGKQIKRLTKELGYDAEGSYSPNGKLIAFASNRSSYKDKFSDEEKKIMEQDGSYAMEIYTMNADGSNVKRLTNTRGYDGGPFFSADGKKITWRRFTPDGNRAEIYTMNVDGTEQKQLTELNSLSWAPFFHPSGEYVVFATSVLGYANFELFMVSTDGGKPIRVTNADGFDGLPSFSPDGKKLSWTHRNEKGESQIYMADWNHEEARKLVGLSTPASAKVKFNLAPDINENDAREIVKYLASEDFKGRMSGSVEEKIYTEQIAGLFASWGLVPAIGSNFVQTFDFTSSVTATIDNSVQFKGRFEAPLKRGEDYQVLSYTKSGDFNAIPVIFAGYGIKAPATDKLQTFDSYQDLDVKGKWVILLDHLPNHPNKEMKQHLLSYSRPQHKITVAKNNNAAGVMIVSDAGIKEVKFEGSLSESTLPVIKISTKTFEKILEKSDAKYKTYASLEKDFDNLAQSTGFALSSQYVSAKIHLTHNKSIGRNVIAKLVPRAKAISKNAKAVLIGAHGDHLGLGENTGSSLARTDEKSKIHFGADDNASGVAGVLELAHYFANPTTAAKLKKPIYFAVWSGEEIGVLGSSYFAKSWKTEKKVDFNQNFEASLNMDMIGRLRDKLQVQGVGSAKEWSGLSEEVGLISGVPLVLTTDPYLPTDSMSFYLAEVPSISFFTGTHEEYHSPRDTADLINYKGLVKVIDIVRSFTEKIASVSLNVVKYEKVEGNSGQKLEGRSFRIYLGTIPDYAQEGVKGVKISGASKNSPAEKAGLKAGDIITEFDKANIENLYDYVYALQSAKPNLPINMSVSREGKKV
ncbi:MAG: M28 family peptidase [Pseudobdellovibrio sp.]